MVFWLIGISGAGKTTIGRRLAAYFAEKDVKHYLLDGDEVRAVFDGDLGYSTTDREANIKRIILAAYALDKCGIVTIVCNISPFEHLRRLARDKIAGYKEIYLKRDVTAAMNADVKGVYGKNAGEAEIIGVNIEFDEPKAPDLTLDTNALSEDETFERLIQYMEKKAKL